MRIIKISAKNIALNAVFVALALIVSYVERLIPFNFGVVGLKLGLTNIVVLIALYTSGPTNAFFVNILRILLVAFLFGNASGFIYSVCGGLLSFAVMTGAKRFKTVGTVGVSVLGGVFHNVGQLLGVIFVLGSFKMGYLLPLLLLTGCLTGCLIGILSWYIINVLESAKRG